MPEKSAGKSGGLLLDFLCSLSPEILEKLYHSTGSTVAIFRALPPIQQLFVSRLVFISEPVPLSILKSWIRTEILAEFDQIVKNLVDLRILLLFSDPENAAVILSPNFQPSIRAGLATKCISGFPDVSKTIEEKHWKSQKELSVYASERWEALLQFLALPSERTQQSVSSVMREVLRSADFIRDTGGKELECKDEILNEVEITSAGFRFLLMERTNQIWTYLIQYLRFIGRKKDENLMVECLSYLLRLSFCAWNQGYSNREVSDSLQDFVQHLRELGLIYMRKRKDGWFHATPLVGHLSGTSTAGSEKINQGFLMVETNYRVYAYTNSVLQLAILSTFCEMVYRFSNLTVGVLTRESVRGAFQVGITSQQIIDYLRSHAHEKMTETSPVLPPSITDQIRLWEFERDRLQFDGAVFYSNFDSEEDYQRLKEFASGRGLILWQEDKSRQLVVTTEGHDAVKQFWKQQKSKKRSI